MSTNKSSGALFKARIFITAGLAVNISIAFNGDHELCFALVRPNVPSAGVLTVTLRAMVDGNHSAIVALLVDDGIEKNLKPTVQVVLVDGHYRIAALPQLASEEEYYNCHSEGFSNMLIYS